MQMIKENEQAALRKDEFWLASADKLARSLSALQPRSQGPLSYSRERTLVVDPGCWGWSRDCENVPKSGS